MKLLTQSNEKIIKGEAIGYRTFGLHLAPATLSGRNVCSHASAGCAAACLNTAGRGQFNKVQRARIAKTNFYFEQEEGFLKLLVKEQHAACRNAKRVGLIPAFRLNLTSDISWHTKSVAGVNLFDLFEPAQFYDYTKVPTRVLTYLAGSLPKNYHLTFSRSECNDVMCRLLLKAGANVAVVFAGELPAAYAGHAVVDGDKDDLRFLDGHNVVVGLSAKGKARQDTSGFVI